MADYYAIQDEDMARPLSLGQIRSKITMRMSSGAGGWLYKHLLFHSWRWIAETCFTKRRHGRQGFAAAVLACKENQTHNGAIGFVGRSSPWPFGFRSIN